MKLLLLFFTVFLICCRSYDDNNEGKKNRITYKVVRYDSESIKEKYVFEAGTLSSIYFLDKEGFIDSIKKFTKGVLSITEKYFYFRNGNINVNTYKENEIIIHEEFDSTMKLLYKTPLDIPKVTHTTYKLKSGRTYFDQTKIDTIEIINTDIPPYNIGFEAVGAHIPPTNQIGKYAIRKFAQKTKTPDSIKIFLTASQNISATNPTRLKVDTIFIPVK